MLLLVHIKSKLRTLVLKLWYSQGNKQNQIVSNLAWFTATLASPQNLLEIQILGPHTRFIKTL